MATTKAMDTPPPAEKRERGRPFKGKARRDNHTVSVEETDWVALQTLARLYTGKMDSVSEMLTAMAKKAEIRPDGSFLVKALQEVPR